MHGQGGLLAAEPREAAVQVGYDEGLPGRQLQGTGKVDLVGDLPGVGVGHAGSRARGRLERFGEPEPLAAAVEVAGERWIRIQLEVKRPDQALVAVRASAFEAEPEGHGDAEQHARVPVDVRARSASGKNGVYRPVAGSTNRLRLNAIPASKVAVGGKLPAMPSEHPQAGIPVDHQLQRCVAVRPAAARSAACGGRCRAAPGRRRFPSSRSTLRNENRLSCFRALRPTR